MKSSNYNKTQLSPDVEFERHIFHRDQFAHYLRWTHVLKTARINQEILDFGCGTGNLLEVLYRNRYRPKRYVGVDIRKRIIASNVERWKDLDFAEFYLADLCEPGLKSFGKFNIVISFEVIEHVGKKNAKNLLLNIIKNCNINSIVLLSTPVYDPRVGAAKNHIIDGHVGEFEFIELKDLLNDLFITENVFGTFASVRDYKPLLKQGTWQLKMYEHLVRYYDSNLVSNIMAPFFPTQSRNCLWRLKPRSVE